MQNQFMNRLPVYDRTTRKLESAAFMSLGAIGLAIIGYATVDSLRFAEGKDEVMAALEKPNAVRAAMVAGTTNNTTPKKAAPRAEQPLGGPSAHSKLMSPQR